MAGADRVQLLAQISAAGALAGGAANLAAGYLSDRTRSPLGRRRPWILAGAALVAVSYGWIHWASSPLALLSGMIAFQIAFNMLFAPLVALAPERVPVQQRGLAAGLFALGSPVGLVLGSVVIGSLITDEAARFAALAAMVLAAIIPFAILIGPDPPARESVETAAGGPAFAWRNFCLGWAGRALVVTAYSLVQTYLLFYVEDALHYGARGLGRPEAGVAQLGLVYGPVNCIMALAAGRLSDQRRLRRPFVILGALAVALGMAGLALAQDWPQALAAYALFGLGAGCHTAVEFALMTELLPSRERFARDLGLLNISNIAPQVLAPLAAGALMGLPGADIRWVFLAGGACAALGAVATAAMRGVR
jgi:MFS family permease